MKFGIKVTVIVLYCIFITIYRLTISSRNVKVNVRPQHSCSTRKEAKIQGIDEDSNEFYLFYFIE